MSKEAKNTIYINNLNHKIKDPELKVELQKTFKKFGKILTIWSSCVFHLRGQAWITFDTVEQAVEAKESMNEQEIFGRPMRINFAKNKADVIAKRDGTYKPRKKRVVESDDDDGENKRRRVEENVGPKKYTIPRPMKPMPQNHILIAEDLPSDCTKVLLQNLFKDFVGVEDIRLIASKNVAFIEFQNEAFASVALKNRNNYRISETNLLFLNYAKK